MVSSMIVLWKYQIYHFPTNMIAIVGVRLLIFAHAHPQNFAES